MYKNEAKQRKKTRDRVKRYRALHKGVTEKALQGVTRGKLPADEQGMTPPIINALLDPKKRAMLEFISQDIKRRGLSGENLFYGVNGLSFSEIPEFLRITANLV